MVEARVFLKEEAWLMEKPAQTCYPIHTLMQRRWSPRVFAKQSVEPYKICACLEAARWAPSCFNEQPWRFFVGAENVNPDALQELQTLLVSGNGWAQKAPVLMLSVAKLNFTYNGEPNRHGQHDVGLAVENFVLQALDMGLMCHQMAGFYVDKAVEVLQIPEGYEPMAMMAMGYPGDPNELDPQLKERELASRERKPLQELVFSNQWGSGFPVCFT